MGSRPQMTGGTQPQEATPWWLQDDVLRHVPWQARWNVERRAWRDPVLYSLYVMMLAVVVLLGLTGRYVEVIGVLLAIIVAFYPFAGRRLRTIIRSDLERRPCFECGYSTIGLTDPRCPECGTPFDPNVYERIAEAIRREKGS